MEPRTFEERRSSPSRPGVSVGTSSPSAADWHRARRADLAVLDAEFRARRDRVGITSDLRLGWDEAIAGIRRAMDAHLEALWACEELDGDEAETRAVLAEAYENAMRAVAERTSRRSAVRESVIRPFGTQGVVSTWRPTASGDAANGHPAHRAISETPSVVNA